jgi:hypothetical protein
MSIIANRSRKLQPVVWRRRRCVQCSKVVTTYETIEAQEQRPGVLGELDLAMATFVQAVEQLRGQLSVEAQIAASEEEGYNGPQSIQ